MVVQTINKKIHLFSCRLCLLCYCCSNSRAWQQHQGHGFDSKRMQELIQCNTNAFDKSLCKFGAKNNDQNTKVFVHSKVHENIKDAGFQTKKLFTLNPKKGQIVVTN